MISKRFADINWTENLQTKRWYLQASWTNSGRSVATFAELFSNTRLPSNLRPTNRKCVYFVMRGHFRSRDKNVSNTIRSAISKNLMLYTQTSWLYFFVKVQLRPIEVCRPKHCGNREFRLFWSCDLYLDPMTFIYELAPYFLKIHQTCKYELRTSRLSKLIIWQTDRQTRPKLCTTPLRGCSIKFNVVV